MLRAIAAALCLALLTVSAAAQDAPDPADTVPNLARDFWCATAYGVASANAAEAGDGVGAISLRESMTALFQRLLLEMQAGGFSRGQYDALAAQYLAAVLDPFRGSADVHTRAECDAAVGEADAFLAVLPAPLAAQAEVR